MPIAVKYDEAVTCRGYGIRKASSEVSAPTIRFFGLGHCSSIGTTECSAPAAGRLPSSGFCRDRLVALQSEFNRVMRYPVQQLDSLTTCYIRKLKAAFRPDPDLPRLGSTGTRVTAMDDRFLCISTVKSFRRNAFDPTRTSSAPPTCVPAHRREAEEAVVGPIS